MKSKIILAGLIVILAVAALNFRRMNPRSTEQFAPAGHTEHEEPWSYKEGRGVTLSGRAQKAAGIGVAPVTSAPIVSGQKQAQAQIYRSALESSSRRTASAFTWLATNEAALFSIGDRVKLSDGMMEYEGQITAVKAPLSQGGASEILLEVDDPQRRLRVGDFLSVHAGHGQTKKSQSLTIPTDAVISSVRGDFVYVVNASSFLRTPVDLGARQDGRVEVLDGLLEGDDIVVTGVSNLWMIELQAINGGKGCADGH